MTDHEKREAIVRALRVAVRQTYGRGRVDVILNGDYVIVDATLNLDWLVGALQQAVREGFK